ncbi:MAG: penicillin-binding protein activator LpoB [bacterium]
MKWINGLATVLAVACLVAAMGCAKKKVTRISEDTVTDLSGRWNDTDSRLVSEEMISDCLSGPWKTRHWEKEGQKPVVIVGIIQNKSSEHIAIDTFIGDMERAFINTGEVTVVASKDEREQVRDERQDQQTYSSEETMKRWGREIGADYMLGGTISSIVDQEKGDRVVFYQVDLNLIDLEDNSKVWLGQKKIKKYIERAGMSY